MARATRTGIIVLGLGLTVLAGCQEGLKPPFGKSSGGSGTTAGAPSPEDTGVAGASSTFVEKDVEAPDVFAANDSGLWDGRPSLGGIWVAHPDVADPERVMIRNDANGKSVVGALFRRERNNPGPKIQVSSDAAAALGMLAGQPTNLDVVALRREEVEVAIPAPVVSEPPVEEGAPAAVAEPESTQTAPAIQSTALDPVATATAAISRAEKQKETRGPQSDLAPPSSAAAVAAADAESTKGADLREPFVQLGIFSVEKNANETANSLRAAGLVPTVRSQDTRGKTFWRVVVGPAATVEERKSLLGKVRDLGFADAYYVKD